MRGVTREALGESSEVDGYSEWKTEIASRLIRTAKCE